MIKRIKIINLCLITFIISCNSNLENAFHFSVPKNKFEKDLPPNYNESLKMNTEKLAKISSIENGFNDFQIRIWLGYVFNDTTQLIVLKKKNGKWDGEFNNLIYQYNNSYDSLYDIKRFTSKVAPVSGWKRFINKLSKTEFINLPDYSTIPGYELPTDASGITVEISSSKKYKFYHYPVPGLYKDRFREADKIIEFITLLEKELNFKRIQKF